MMPRKRPPMAAPIIMLVDGWSEPLSDATANVLSIKLKKNKKNKSKVES